MAFSREDALATSLRTAMHAMAQPLTRLQMRLGLELQSEGEQQTPPADLNAEACRVREVIVQTTGDVQQLCLLFRQMQQIVLVESTAARCCETLLSPIIDRLVLDAEASFRDSGAGFELRFSPEPNLARGGAGPALLPGLIQVMVDARRTRQALLEMLTVVRTTAPGTSVVCTVGIDPLSVQIEMRVQKRGADQGKEQGAASGAVILDEAAGLRIATARANMLSQGGSFTHTVRPLTMCLGLPRAGQEP